jgi:hypothetical protein
VRVFAFFAHETAGAARIRHSPRPLISRRESFWQNLGQIAPRECGLLPINVIASEAKQSIELQERKLDCFVASLLAMTFL